MRRCSGAVEEPAEPGSLASPAIDTSELLKVASALHEECADVPISLELPGAAEARRAAAAIRRQLSDYVIPRLRDIDAPALAVVGGSTGSGKSTIVNSLVGEEVSKASVLRPTTRSPVLVHHPDSAAWFEGTRVLGGLSRVGGGPATSPNQLELVARPSIPATIAVVDAPDFDSVVDANREIAAQLLAAADLWVFVTTAARYADAVPWAFLRSAVARGVHVAIVLNRVPTGAAAEVGPHLAEMLSTEGLGTAPVFTIDEQLLSGGLLPEASIQPLRAWLGALATDQQARAAIIRRSLAGTIGELAAQADRLAGAVRYQGEFVRWLADRVEDAFRRAQTSIVADIRDGTVMRGEVLARWQDLVGSGELLKQLQSAIGRLGDRIAAALTGRPQPTERFQGAVSHGVEIVVRERTAQATDETAGHWSVQPAGQALLDAARSDGVDLSRPGPDLDERTARLVRDWQASVLELLRREGTGKRRTAKALSYGINGVAAVLMVGIFAQTGGLTGAEVVIAGGSSAVGQQLVAALLGDQAVRTLTATARADLERRIGEQVLDVEAQRFLSVLELHRTGDRGDRLAEIGRQLAAGLER